MSSPLVGDVLTTVEQLDACPEGTILRSNLGGVAVKEDNSSIRPWGVKGAWFQSDGLVFPKVHPTSEWSVVWVPPVTRIEFEAVVQDFGCDGTVRPFVWRDEFGRGPFAGVDGRCA